MKSFLLQVAEKIIENHGNNLGEICIVMPNRRAGLFLKKHLSSLIQKPVWSPDIFSVEDFFFHLSGFSPANPINLLLDLYQVHKELNPDTYQPLDEFITWAPVLLSDFNDIDFHLAGAATLYNYLNEAKAIEKWNLGRRSLSDFEKEYLKFFNSMHGYYLGIRKICLEKKEAYQGMVYRMLAENPELIKNGFNWTKVYFAGFNALTPAEKKIMQFFEENGMSQSFWDADEYYFSDDRQEAGFFLRQQLSGENRQKINWVGNWMKETEKKVFITGTPRKTGQAALAGKIVNHWIKNSIDLRNAAIVLADETLLMPVLNSLPDSIGNFNVTMGYPLKSTQLFQLFKSVYRLFENIERLSNLNTNRPKGFYFQDIIKIVQHPAMGNFINAGAFVEAISGSNKVFYFANELLPVIREFSAPGKTILAEIFENTSSTSPQILKLTGKLIAALRNALIELKKGSDNQNIDNEIEYLYQFSLINQKLETLFGHNTTSSIRILRLFFNSLVSSTRVPFYGEPLQGLQILGILETRNLDFEKVILLSVNEGTLPSTSIGNSFIPFDIQKTFNLPTVQENNAVFAYHFYRLLQRAGEVHLIYDTEGTRLGGGEKSRFIHQILQELRHSATGISIVESIESPPIPEKQANRTIYVRKSENVYQALLEKAKTGFAPTSLNRFRDCPLQFYLTDIAGIEETEEVEETLEYRTIGIIAHEVLENLYSDFKGKKVSVDDIATMIGRVDKQLELSFAANYKKGEIAFGKNKLIYEVIRNFIHSFLTFEKDFLSNGDQKPVLEIVELERKIGFSAQFPGLPLIKFKGTIDRIDKVNGKLRIIDYKTGLVDASKELIFRSWEDFLEKNHTGKAFQLLMYAWLYQQENLHQEETIESGIFSLRTLSAGLQSFGIKAAPKEPADTLLDEEKLTLFEQLLYKTISDIFDRESEFAQTDDPEVCRNCIFKDVCIR